VASSAAERNLRIFNGPFGAVYDRYMESERASKLIARLVWGSDVSHYYASMEAIQQVPDGGVIVDAPCGGGVALRALEPGRDVRYRAFDLSPKMAQRAERRAATRGLSQVAVAVADARALPVPDESADLFLSYFGLHCLDDPEAALREAARVLASGRDLVGSSIVRGSRRLDRFRVHPGRGAFGRVGTESDLRDWLSAAGFEQIQIETRGLLSVFAGTRATRVQRP
jgi:SAM-dependent methyltransferase